MDKKGSKIQDEETLRTKFRWEFVRRNRKFQTALFTNYDSLHRLDTIPYFKEEFGLQWTVSDVEEVREIVDGRKDLKNRLRLWDLFPPTISIISDLRWADDKDFNLNEINSHIEDLEIFGDGFEWDIKDFACGAINPDENTIAIKINLNRKRGSIIRDIRALLDLLKNEIAYFRLDYKKNLNPQWEVYEKYLAVYDLKEKNPSMEWPEIAKIIFPSEVVKRKAPHRQTKKSEVPSRTAIDKVRHYWREANKVINKGGWKRI